MDSTARGQPLSLAHIPIGQVTRLAGLDEGQLAVALDPLPVGAPVVIRHRLPRVAPSPTHAVHDVLGRLETIAMDLFPACW